MKPFRIEVAQSDLDDLHRRLDATRWPDDPPGYGWARGVPLDYLKELAAYWRTSYDWRAAEAQLNRFPQFVTEIDGANVHFLHVRSPEPDAVPLLITHGWPGSVAEFVDIIEPLTDPARHGGRGSDAFHVVIPALPGFGFSGPTREPGWDVGRIAGAWAQLMHRLGYHRYIPQGGDVGAWISMALATLDSAHVLGVHVNFLFTPPPDDPAALAGLGEPDLERLRQLERFLSERSAYMLLQATRPQTLAYGLTDSPVGQLAWMVDKFWEWSDSKTSPEDAIHRDLLLTNVMFYWLTASAGSSAQFYFEMADALPAAATPPPPPVPLGVAVFPQDAVRPVRRLAEQAFPHIVQWHEFDRGGHFAAMEQPDLLVEDLRQFATVLGS